MSKQSFVKFVEGIISQGNVPADVVDYFEKTIKAKKVNKKEVEKAEVLKNAIVDFLAKNSGKFFDRVEIGDALYNDASFPEEFIVNDKNGVAYNSITAFANQLVTDGKIVKQEIKEGKATKIKYCA